jgi:LacI family repressor for deo operon, udp, cdd, tsx, nupC, and nupG
MSITIQDVADAAGVSISTVSRALAGSPRVKVETRQRVQRIAREMGFAPSAIARGLATKRTYNLGVVVRDIADPFIAELTRVMDKTALEFGYSLILCHSSDDPERGLAAINILRRQRVDAIIIPDPFAANSFFPFLEKNQLPVILLNKKDYPFSVGTDNIQAAFLAINHLLSLGHKHIGYIGACISLEEDEERRIGYRQALANRGISPDPSYYCEGDGRPEGGRRCAGKLMKLPNPPTAIFCYNDLTAIGAISGLNACGKNVPKDISIVGFDGISIGANMNPPLTTVRQQIDKLACLAVEMALRMIDNKGWREQIILPGELVIRASTAPPLLQNDPLDEE